MKLPDTAHYYVKSYIETQNKLSKKVELDKKKYQPLSSSCVWKNGLLVSIYIKLIQLLILTEFMIKKMQTGAS